MEDDDRSNRPVHIGEAAERVLKRIKKSAANLRIVEHQYNCSECEDKGLVEQDGRFSRCKCVSEAKPDEGKFF